MKKFFIIGVCALLVSCGQVACNSDFPVPPYENPDNTVEQRSEGISAVLYSYNCHEGKYRNVTYTQVQCSGWQKTETTAECIIK